MEIELKELLARYASEMHEGDAALFVGAGMSWPAGYVDWKRLLSGCAKELGLNIDREGHDLVALAQYYLNSRGGDRSYLNKILKDEFDRRGTCTENHRLIAKLPISTIWTTNFDRLIEQALKEAHKLYHRKSRDQDIAQSTSGREVVIYKMHGEIARADKIVICQDDYERYAKTHPIFQNALEGDLLTKTFLFLGFSFTDPNLNHMLGHLRSLLEDSKRTHYAIMRRVRFDWDKAEDEDFAYETTKQKLQIRNLDRYSIDTFLVDEYDQITEVLKALDSEYSKRNIFVSGGAHEYGDFGPEQLHELCRQLGDRLIDEGLKLSTDFRSLVGRSLLDGALPKLDEKHFSSIERYLLRPLPKGLSAKSSEAAFDRACREEAARNCAFVIYIGGDGADYEEVMGDFKFAAQLETIPIPIGVSGRAASDIWQTIQRDFGTFYPDAVSIKTYAKLNDKGLNINELLNAVSEIISKVSDVEPKLSERSGLSEEKRRSLYASLKREHPTLTPNQLRSIVGG